VFLVQKIKVLITHIAVKSIFVSHTTVGFGTKQTSDKCNFHVTVITINPLPVQFKSLLPGQEGCIFFSGRLNVRKYHYALARLGRQVAFKSTML
jgi:hypothetical protein